MPLTADPGAKAGWDWLLTLLGRDARVVDYKLVPTTTSSTLLDVQVRGSSVTNRVALRLYDNEAWLAEAPDLVVHEAAALKIAETSNLRAPRLIGWSAADIGFGTGCLAMTWTDGDVVVRPSRLDHWLQHLAAELAAIHQCRADMAFPWRYRSWVDDARLRVPTSTRVPEKWRRVIDLWRAGAPVHAPVLIHRDFHPANVLWRDNAIVGVVDWPNACLGPAALDVAHCSYNLALMHGVDAVVAFRAAYQRAMPTHQQDVYWDANSLLDKSRVRYYPPWRLFGLGHIDDAELVRRVDDHVAYFIEMV